MGGTDDYYVDENGSLKRTKRGEGITRFTVSNDHSQQISFNADFNVETVSMTYAYTDENGKEETRTTEATLVTIEDPEQAKQLFEFMADHTDVEFSLTSMTQKIPKNKTKNVVSTSHAEDADVTMSAVVDANKNSFYINDLFHSHPGGTDPSEDDEIYRDLLYNNLNQYIPQKNWIYKPSKINRHSTPVNYRFGTDKYNKKYINGKYLQY